MSIMQDHEKIRNIIGNKKYDAIEEYVETFGNIKEYDEGVKKLRKIKDINKWEVEMQKLHEKCKPIFIEDVAMNREEWEKFEKWYAGKLQKKKEMKKQRNKEAR